MQENIVLEHLRQADYVEIQIYVSLGRAAAPVAGIMLYGHLIIYESISGGEPGKARRQFGLGLPAQGLDLAGSRRPHILHALLLTRHSLQDPLAASLEKQPCSRVGHDIRHRHAHSLDRVHAYADAPAPETLPEHDLPNFRIHQYLPYMTSHTKNCIFLPNLAKIYS